MKFINNLDHIMWQRRISNAELARRSGVDAARIGAIRNNPRENTTIETMEKICNALGVGLNELISVEQESQTPVTA